MNDRMRRKNSNRPSFTLVELLVVISIIAVLAGAVLSALSGVVDEAKHARTKSQIAKLHSLIMAKWEGYRTRPIRMTIPAGTTSSGITLARVKLFALRDLMRMELPDRITDLDNGSVTLTVPKDDGSGNVTLTLPNPSLWKSYRRRAGYAPTATSQPTWTFQHQGAECLYLIVAAMRDENTSGLEFFREKEIGDVDGDGMPEILDGWGNPIEFLRWAPGFSPESDIQSSNASASPDPFDPLKVDPRWTDSDSTNDPFMLIPLIYSAGPDGAYGVASDYDTIPSTVATDIDDPNYDHFRQTTASPYRSDPYHVEATSLGTGFGAISAGTDILSNHFLDSSR